MGVYVCVYAYAYTHLTHASTSNWLNKSLFGTIFAIVFPMVAFPTNTSTVDINIYMSV